jgi:hypothetical protein
MFVLNNLSEAGYLQIKKDKEQLIKKIQQYQALVDEFDLALPFLTAIYEPTIKLSFEGVNKEILMARTSIPMNDGEKRIIRARVGSKDDFPMGEKDNKAVLRATEIIKYRIKKEFPLHFED